MRALIMALVVVGLPTIAFGDPPSDLDLYIEGIRTSGVSEMGSSHVSVIASICTGSSIMVFRADPTSGRYWPSYQSATCPNPNANDPELERWKKLKLSDADKLRMELKSFADADASGFVTTEEAWQFRRLIEFGWLAAQVVEDEGPMLDKIARASGLSEDDAATRLKEYKDLARRIDESGVTDDLPALVIADAGPVFQ